MRRWLLLALGALLLAGHVTAAQVPPPEQPEEPVDLTYWVPELDSVLVAGTLPRAILPPSLRDLSAEELAELRLQEDGLAFDYNCAENFLPMIPYELRALALAKVLGNEFMAEQSLRFLYIAYINSEHPAEALQCAETALAAAQAAARPGLPLAGEAEHLADIALAYYYLGDQEQALSFAQQALEFKRGGWDVDQALLIIAQVYIDRQDYPAAMDWVEQALEHYQVTEFPFGQVKMLCLRGELKQEQGDLAGAAADYAAAEELARGETGVAAMVYPLTRQASLALEQCEPERARELYQQVVALAREWDDTEHETQAQLGLGKVCLAQGEPEAAIGHCEVALALCAECGLKQYRPAVLLADGEAFLKLGRYDRARELYSQARASNSGGNQAVERKALTKLAEIELVTQHYAAALESLDAVLPLLDPQVRPADYRRARFNRGQASAGLERFAEAAADLTEAARLGRAAMGTGFFCPAEALLAYVRLRQADPAGALDAARRAKNVAPPELAAGEAWLELLLVPSLPAPATADRRCSDSGDAGEYVLLLLLERPGAAVGFARLDFNVPDRQTLAEYIAGFARDLHGDIENNRNYRRRWLFKELMDPLVADPAGFTRLYVCPDPALAGLDYAQFILPDGRILGEMCAVVEVAVEAQSPPEG